MAKPDQTQQFAPGEEAFYEGQNTPYDGADPQPRYYGQSLNEAFQEGVEFGFQA